MDLTTRVSLVQNLLTTKEIPASVGAKLLDINRTSIYYKTSPVSDEELACKEIIDHLHTDNPTWGARQMSAQLKNRCYHVGRRKARRYMNEMDIYPIYPKMNLSKRVQQAKVCPYLLRNAVIDAPNQAWSIDITYIPIRHGFLYLTAVIDWYSRCIVGWEVDDTLDTRMVINALKKALGQFTRNYTQTVKRAADNKRRYAPGWVHSTCLLRGFPKGAAPHLAHDFAEQSVVCYTLCRRCPENTVAAGEGKGI